jgi:hypothetical protein
MANCCEPPFLACKIMSTPNAHRTAREWDKVRLDFQTSILVDTALSSLAQNLDGADWPLSDPDETPAKYIDLSFDELCLSPGMAGHAERIDQLISILEETLAFDNPFGEMVAQSAAASEQENPLLKTLTRLDIPLDFPIEMSRLSEDVKAFCSAESINTLAEFARFAQNMPPQIVVGGDFRTLLNALAHMNEEALAALLPFRAGSKGLHLPEALGQLVDSLAPAQRLALLKRSGVFLTDEEKITAAELEPGEVQQLEQSLQLRAARVQKQFPTEVRELPAVIKDRGSLARYLVVLGNPQKEALVAKLLEPMQAGNAPADAPAPAPKAGLWAALTRWFRK